METAELEFPIYILGRSARPQWPASGVVGRAVPFVTHHPVLFTAVFVSACHSPGAPGWPPLFSSEILLITGVFFQDQSWSWKKISARDQKGPAQKQACGKVNRLEGPP